VEESGANPRKVGRAASFLERKWNQPSKPGKTRKDAQMTRLTKCLVAAAVVAGIGFTAQSASAHPPTVIVNPTVAPYPTYYTPRPVLYPPVVVNPILPRHDHDYLVLTRTSPFAGWQIYGKFETRYGAEAAERRLEWQGIPTRIVRTCDYYGSGYRW
jgi:hypothetical protein